MEKLLYKYFNSWKFTLYEFLRGINMELSVLNKTKLQKDSIGYTDGDGEINAGQFKATQIFLGWSTGYTAWHLFKESVSY